ncbi:MAG: hypothetical protein QGI49_00890 [SAR202 cluster bacterium]|nr:hypothetical protein [SAR202 cluster bacterium]
MTDGYAVLFFRLVLGIFLGFTCMVIGYVLSWAALLSLPGNLEISSSGGLAGMALGAGIGASIGWWETKTQRRYQLAAVVVVIGIALLGAWIGQQLVSVEIAGARASVQRFKPVAFGAFLGGNITALAIYSILAFVRTHGSRFSRTSRA